MILMNKTMRQYNYLQAVPLSFFSAKLYRDVAQHWRGIGLIYLVLIAIITSCILGWRLELLYRNFVLHQVPLIIEQLPTMELQAGKLEVQAAMPYVLQDPHSGDKLLLIDTKAKTSELKQQKALVSISQQDIVYTFFSHRQLVIPLATLSDFRLDKAIVQRDITKFLQQAHYLSFLLILLGVLLRQIAFNLLFSLFGLVCVKQMQLSLSYKAIFRLLAVALTPIYLLNLLPINLPFSNLCFLLLSFLYVYFAIWSNKHMTSIQGQR
jgi:hypothetical protein